MADQIGARIVVKLLTRVLIEVAVAADGVSDGRMYPDDPVSGMAFTTEGDLDTQVPQEGLRAAQAAGERPGTFGSAGAGARGTAPAAIGADTRRSFALCEGERFANVVETCYSQSAKRD